MVSKLWKNYNSTHAYDGYFTKDNKLRKHATIISSILERYGKKKLQEISANFFCLVRNLAMLKFHEVNSFGRSALK